MTIRIQKNGSSAQRTTRDELLSEERVGGRKEGC
jgi:hypothetical protein